MSHSFLTHLMDIQLVSSFGFYKQCLMLHTYTKSE